MNALGGPFYNGPFYHGPRPSRFAGTSPHLPARVLASALASIPGSVPNFVLVVVLAGVMGCASAQVGPSSSSSEEITSPQSGAWDDQDSDAVAQAIIHEALLAPWIQEWSQKHAGKKPVVRVHPVKNRSVNYIDYRYLTKQLEHAFVASGRCEVVTSADEAESIRSERSDQYQHASDESTKSHGNELGSDFILTGTILSEDLEIRGQWVRAYLASIEIVETETGRKAWIGQKKIQKPLPGA